MSKRVALPSAQILTCTVRPAGNRPTRRSVRLVPASGCPYWSQQYSPPNRNLRIAASPTFTFLVFVVSSSLLAVGSIYLNGSESNTKNRNIATSKSEQTIVTEGGIMAGPALPGRPGNLTADQEAKLRELWTATLKVFGVQAQDKTEDLKDLQPGSVAATPDQKAKKKKHSMFKRNKDDDGEGTSTDQEDKYGQSKEFQQVLATENPENLRKAFWSMVKHDHPDGLLLRFLRARKWDVHNALVMLIATMNWRMKTMHVDDDIMKKGEGQAVTDSLSSNTAVKKEAQDFLAQLRVGKSFLHGTDREGRPMCFVRVRLHKQGEQSETSLERYTVYTIETARLLLAPPVDTAVSSDDDTGLPCLLSGRPSSLI